MSWKGFTKGIARAPQGMKQKFNIGEITKDPVYADAERRFKELEVETKKLAVESKRYADAINGILKHQIGFSKAVEEIYKPISGRMSDPDSIVQEGNPEGIRACEEYEIIVKELQETLAPELDMIETRIIKPAEEMLDVIKMIRKMAQKRDRKQIDYDRHRASLKKLEDKKEKTLKDEKALYQAEAAVEQATQEYDYYNEVLKQDLPKLFKLEAEFIRPLFQSFYYMQLNVFYTLYERMQRVDIGYFDLTRDLDEAFVQKRGDIQEQAEALGITRYKTARPTSKPLGRKGIEPSIERSRASSLTSRRDDSLPQYSPGVRANSLSRVNGDKKPPPPAAKPKPAALQRKEYVTALYDYTAQAEGDLSFQAGDRIEIVHKTANANEWWSGKINNQTGNFPANYVQ